MCVVRCVLRVVCCVWWVGVRRGCGLEFDVAVEGVLSWRFATQNIKFSNLVAFSVCLRGFSVDVYVGSRLAFTLVFGCGVLLSLVS